MRYLNVSSLLAVTAYNTLGTRSNIVLMKIADQIAQIGSCDKSRIHVSDRGGTGVWPGKNSFHKKWINLDNNAVY